MYVIKEEDSNLRSFVYGTRSGKVVFTGSRASCQAYIQMIMIDIKRRRRNAKARQINQVLRDLTGTSAHAARLDMGLNGGGY
jgi:hypothetical protein